MPFCVISCQKFVNRKTDKEGVMLNPIAGKVPHKRVLSNEVASNAGFQIGETYLAEWKQLDDDDVHGSQFRWLSHKIANYSDILDSQKAMGEGKVIEILEKVI